MRSVRARLTLFTIAVTALTLIAMALFLRNRVAANLQSEVNRRLDDSVATVRTGAGGDLPKVVLPKGVLPNRIEVGGAEQHVIQIVKSAQGEARLETRTPVPRIVPADGRRTGPLDVEDPIGMAAVRETPYYNDYKKNGEPMRSLTIPVRNERGGVVAYAQAVGSLVPVQQGVADLDRALFASIPVALALAAIVGFLTVGRATRPLRRMIEASERLDDTGLRLPVEGRDEFAELAESLNGAFDRQNQALAQLERFTGDAGHELRTPLATIKTNASFLAHIAETPEELRPPIRAIDVSADRMARLIDDLLLLARHDGGELKPRRRHTDIDELLVAAVENLDSKDGVTIRVVGPPVGIAPIDPDSVERTIQNLLANAHDYACTEVELSGWVEDGYLVLEVKDDGPGIAPEDLARLGERFFRPDEARSRERGGVGLGVAIARSLCERYGGDLTYRSEIGKGTVARARVALGAPEIANGG